MNIKKFFNMNALKISILFLLFIIIASIIAHFSLSGMENAYRHKQILLKRDGFDRIIETLEFEGVNEKAKKAISDFGNLSGGYSNVIIADDGGKVVYSLNEGYLPGNGLFRVIVDPNDEHPYFGFIVDSNNNIKYQVRLENTFNYVKLKLDSMNSGIAGVLFPEQGRIMLEAGGNAAASNNRVYVSINSIDTNISMNYAYIGSKGWNLYAIYKSRDYSGSGYYNSGEFKMLQSVPPVTGPISLILFWALLPLWVFTDARRREFKAPMWGLLTLITNVIGLAVYLVVRPEPTACKNCGKHLSSSFVSCPYCGTQNREVCTSCRKLINDDWMACPYCGQSRQADNPSVSL